MISLFFHNTLISKSLLPTLVHDDPTRILISIATIILVSIIFYKVIRYFNGH